MALHHKRDSGYAGINSGCKRWFQIIHKIISYFGFFSNLMTGWLFQTRWGDGGFFRYNVGIRLFMADM